MTLKSYLVSRVAEKLFSPETLKKTRAKSERARVKAGTSHVIDFFHDQSDPYSQLLMEALSDFPFRYAIQLTINLVGQPAADAAPERKKLRHYAKLDAARLDKHAGLDFQFIKTPAAENRSEADARLAKLGHYQGGMLYYGGEWY